jgi:SAM-dependent methyltransferase
MVTKEEIRFGCFASDKKIVRCQSCGLVRLSPPWTSQELDQLYQDYWNKEDFKGQRRKIKVSKYLAKYINKEDNVLEVGCGHGDNVRFLQGLGIKVMGIDKDRLVCDGISVVHSDIETYRPMRKLDVIYAIHLFEHLPDPKAFVQWLKDNSRRFILEIPCVDDVLMKLPAYKRFCWYPYHLFFYSMKTARLFFGPNAEIRYRQEYGIVNHLRWLILGRPGNWNPHIPVIDSIYKRLLMTLGYGDTLVICST